MIKSDKIDELVKALVKVQGRIKGAVKDSNNPFFKSKYADLASNWDAAKDAGLHDEGLVVIQTNSINDRGSVVVETTLAHTSGQFMTGQLEIPVAKANDPQAVGSAITYARRYALAAILGISPEDDDGNKASAKENPKQVIKPVSAAAQKAYAKAEETGTSPEMNAEGAAEYISVKIHQAKSVEELTVLVPHIQKTKASMKPTEYDNIATAFREKKLELSQKVQ